MSQSRPPKIPVSSSVPTSPPLTSPTSPVALARSISNHSTTSTRSHRSTRPRRRRPPAPGASLSTSASASTNLSDKSLTSFPSFSGESPRLGDGFEFGSIGGNLSPSKGKNPMRPPLSRARSAVSNARGAGRSLSRSCSQDRFGGGFIPVVAPAQPVTTATTTTRGGGNITAAIVENLMKKAVEDTVAKSGISMSAREGLFEDNPIAIQKIPGALHLADNEHIERLIARHGAVGLVRQIAEDLATRDLQMAATRRRAEERERALRRICRESGLSNLELENRLKAVEAEMRAAEEKKRIENHSVLSGMMSDAMGSDFIGDEDTRNDATIREASDLVAQVQAEAEAKHRQTGSKGTTKGWKEYIWGGSKKSELPVPTARKVPKMNERRLSQDDRFNPPETDSSTAASGQVRSPSRLSNASINTTQSESSRKTSLALLALRLVVGEPRDPDSPRGRSRTAASNLTAEHNTAKARPSPATKALSKQLTTQGSISSLNSAKSRMAEGSRRGPVAVGIAGRSQLPERWDTMKNSPPGGQTAVSADENYGPVEMDTILPPDEQPPTLTRIYNRYAIKENLLTDRFGFIYDQRRKKRQREAALMAQQIAKNGKKPQEMLTNNNSRVSGHVADDHEESEVGSMRPGSPEAEATGDDASSIKGGWQDYLRVATFPTELLAHTPSMSGAAVEVTEGDTERLGKRKGGFAPGRAAVTTSGSEEDVSRMSGETETSTTETPENSPTAADVPAADDTEPVKMLLKQLSDMHDQLQREREVRWNEFLRKVRAERKREGEAAVAAAAAAADARFKAPAVILPEAKLADGEIIGIAGLGNKGKVGRAKWNEFKALVLGGIPVTYRAKIWVECSGATELKVPGYYDDIVAQGAQGLDESVVSQIDMDIRRTLTDNIFFRKGPGVDKLNEVLLAYAHRNKDVGYCQGMNLIAANLLLITPTAEDAFWIMSSIIENILPEGYYDHWLLASRADQHVLREYVATLLPRLSAHLDNLNIELEALTFQWFLSVFTDCLSAEALFRVWDVILCTQDGSTFLFQVALALLKLNEQALLTCEGAAAVYTYINHQMTNHAISIDGLVRASEGLRRVVKREDMEEKRKRAQERERNVLKEREERLAAMAAKNGSGSGSRSVSVIS